MSNAEKLVACLLLFILLGMFVGLAVDISRELGDLQQEAVDRGYAERVVSDDGHRVIWRWKDE